MASRAMLVREAPELFESEQDLAKRLVKLSVAIRDWEKLLLAIDFQLAQQHQFVAWWDEGVRSKGRPVNAHVRGQLSQAEAEARTGIANQQVSRWRGLLSSNQIGAYRQRLRDAAYKEAGILPRASHRTLGTGDIEWFTPSAYVDAARAVLGEIDLDPATHPKAQKWIKAKQFFTRTEDGLKQAWHGRVWLNPPYGRIEVVKFVNKLIDHYQSKEVTAAILLTHNYTDTKWFHAAAAACQMICFTRGRISFEDNTGETCVPAQGQAFFYFGAEAHRFAERFQPIGFLAEPVT